MIRYEVDNMAAGDRNDDTQIVPRTLAITARQWDDLHKTAVWQESMPAWLELPDEAWDSITEYIANSFEGLFIDDIEVLDVETARGGRLVLIVQDSLMKEHRVQLKRGKGRK